MRRVELRLSVGEFVPRAYRADGREVSCRAILGAPYCAKPVDPIQRVNVFVPEEYFTGGSVGGYNAVTAPIFMPNSVGGYLPGPAEEPGDDARNGGANSLFRALEHGLVVVSGGVRGRTSGKRSDEFFEGADAGYRGVETGRMVGRAPALVVDQKAIVRFVRLNADVIPGNAERIVTNGTSAGGALSALMGATGNDPGYEPYLERIGAASGRDDVFASNCFCPIHNLEHADAAYEWQFAGEREWHRTKHKVVDGVVTRVPVSGELTDAQMELSARLAARFPDYVDGLGLTDPEGRLLTLNPDGSGSFRDFVVGKLVDSAQRELRLHEDVAASIGKSIPGSAVDQVNALDVRDERVCGLDWRAYIHAITRMKATPAFDASDLSSPENEEFGDQTVGARHFSADREVLGYPNGPGEMADPEVVRLMNPIPHIHPDIPTRHWRIRHGSFDRDTSFAIPVILATRLRNVGCDVDFRIPWGVPHAGDYQMDELFAWVDGLCG
jgi:acetyl esterase/lipase